MKKLRMTSIRGDFFFFRSRAYSCSSEKVTLSPAAVLLSCFRLAKMKRASDRSRSGRTSNKPSKADTDAGKFRQHHLSRVDGPLGHSER